MEDDMQLKRPDSLNKTAENAIRHGIITGQFQLGESLQESKLVTALGISKTPIREALVALNLQGLVKIIPQRGAFVFSLSQEDVVQLCRYRLILEFAAMDQALSENPGALFEELREIVRKMTAARERGAFEDYLELDADFHDAFFNQCANSYLKEGYQKVGDIVRTIRTHLSKRPDRQTKSFEEHETILTQLVEGRVKAAKNILKRQITRGERSYCDLVAPEDR